MYLGDLEPCCGPYTIYRNVDGSDEDSYAKLSLIALLRSLEHGELTSLSQIEHSHKLGYSWGTSIRALEIAGAKRNKARILEAVLTCLVKELNPD